MSNDENWHLKAANLKIMLLVVSNLILNTFAFPAFCKNVVVFTVAVCEIVKPEPPWRGESFKWCISWHPGYGKKLNQSKKVK